jgi:hypothetical protein
MAFVGIYRAKYDYQPQTSEELDVRDGDLLFVLDKTSDDEWWTCKKKAEDEDDDEPEGLVPYNYVEEAEVLYQAKSLYEYSKQTDEELSFEAEQVVQVYDTTDPDWTLVGLRGSYGFVPAIYIEKTPASAPASAAAPAPAPPAMPPRPSADDGPLPGEADYPSPTSPGQQANNPAAQLANILAQKTGTGSSEPTPTAQRALASPPLPSRNQVYTPEESEEDEAPPPKPARPASQSISSPPQVASPVRSPKRSESQYIPSGTAEAPGIMPDYDEPSSSPRSPGGYHLYNIHESITHMGKQKKLPMTLGINVLKGTIMISPEKSRDGPQQEWTAEKLTHYSIEGKHVFVELVRPSKSVDFHAGAKDTAQEIVAHLGELAGASRAEGLREVLAASQGSQYGGMKKGKMLYEFMAQGEDEVTVAVDDEVIVLDDARSEEWWMVRRLKNGKEGVVPSSYVEITGTIPEATQSYSGINAGRSTVEQNRLEEERLSKEAAKNSASARGIPERQSSLTPEASSSRRHSNRRSGGGKSKPNPSRIRTWTDRSGTFKVEAEFIGLREGKIHLHKLNGVKIAVPVTKMSVEDLEYVERATGASLDEDKPLSDIKRRSTQRAVNKAAGGAGATVVPKDHEYWFDFFLQCGVNPQICERYAQAFSKDQMSQEVLPEVNAALLRTLGLKEGDILRVMKFLDNKFNRERSTVGAGENGAAGGLFSGPGGALKNNTSKGRPAPAVQTNDVISEDAFKTKEEADAKSPTAGEGAQKTILASAPAREPKGGFDDDAWAPKPSRTQTPDAAPRSALPTEESKKVEQLTAKPRVNDDIASLSITSPPLQPTVARLPNTAPSGGISPAQSPPPQQSQQPQGANKDIFDKIASLAPARQRPQPPPQQQAPGGALGVPPPPRASSAPGFSPQNTAFGNVAPLQAQLTGYQPQQPQYGHQPGLQPQQTAFQYGAPTGFQPNGYPQQQPQMPQVTGIQAIQQNYPALQPQPTGLNFQPQSQFGQQSQAQHYGPPQGLQQQQYQQQLINGAQSSASPFADPPRQPYQPGIGSGLSQSFTAQQTGYQPQQQQPNFNISQPTGLNGFQPQPPSQLPNPNLPPQQTGGVFGPSQPLGLGAPPAPLVPQKTGPPPPVRFGVKPGEKKLMPQPTGRANLAKASEYHPYIMICWMVHADVRSSASKSVWFLNLRSGVFGEYCRSL